MIQTLFGSVEQEPSLLERLKSGVEKTRAGLVSALEDALQGKKEIDADLLDELESTLIAADIGVRTTDEILERIRQSVERHQLGDAAGLKGLIREQLLEILQASERAPARVASPPAVILVVGVNGSGKTTTIGKLAQRHVSEGRSVVLAAGDTFRAAASEQLQQWADRTGADIVRAAEGADPGSVVHDALGRAAARGADIVVADTAGRRANSTNLLDELSKIRRVADRDPGQVVETFMVLDATTGQNALSQAREFLAAASVTGIVLTKLDGTARGGIVVAIERELAIPVKFVGVGEGVGDLIVFDPKAFVDSLLDA